MPTPDPTDQAVDEAGTHRTFDVFDTVLTRAVGDPRATFLVLGRRLVDKGVVTCSPPVYAAARARAEGAAIVNSGGPVTLLRIHEEACAALGLDVATAGASAAIELDLERELSRVVPGAPMRLATARSGSVGGRLTFISDTPLPATFLVELLTAGGLWQEGDRCFSSADEGCDKRSGALFDRVAEALGVDTTALFHVGDDRLSDVGAAGTRGVRAEAAPGGRLNRYERLLEGESVVTDGVSSFLAGASRLARLEAAQRGTAPAVADVASGVFAPTLVAYCLWLVQQCRTRRLRRLYFVARDGEVLCDVARLVFARLDPEVECRYLYGSRAAWHLPSAAGRAADRPFADWVGDPGDPNLTMRRLLRIVGLDLEEAAALGLPVDPARGDDRMSWETRTRIVEALEDGPAGRAVRAAAGRSLDLVVDYFEQEGLDEDIPTALVDTGWLGRTSRSFDAIGASAGHPPVAAFLYVGLERGTTAYGGAEMASRRVAWLFDEDAGTGLPRPILSNIYLLVETMCAGREGTTVGYRREGDRVEPVLVSPENAPALAWGLDDVRAVVMAAAGHLLDAVTPGGEIDLRPACDALMRAFWQHPDRDEAKVWSSFPYDTDGTPERQRSLAEPVRLRAVLEGARRRRIALRPRSSWLGGTAGISGQPFRGLLTMRTTAQPKLDRARRVPTRLARELAVRKSR